MQGLEESSLGIETGPVEGRRLPQGPVFLRLSVRALVFPPPVPMPVVLARFTHGADPIKRKDCPWQLLAFLTRITLWKQVGIPKPLLVIRHFSALCCVRQPTQADRTGQAALQYSYFTGDKHSRSRGTLALGIQG